MIFFVPIIISDASYLLLFTLSNIKTSHGIIKITNDQIIFSFDEILMNHIYDQNLKMYVNEPIYIVIYLLTFRQWFKSEEKMIKTFVRII